VHLAQLSWGAFGSRNPVVGLLRISETPNKREKKSLQSTIFVCAKLELLEVLTDGWKVIERPQCWRQFVVKAHVIFALADALYFALVNVENHPPLTHPLRLFQAEPVSESVADD
jgi:hypothetical protein